jgi:hypothetical protein
MYVEKCNSGKFNIMDLSERELKILCVFCTQALTKDFEGIPANIEIPHRNLHEAILRQECLGLVNKMTNAILES